MNKTQNKSLTAHTCEHYRLWYSLHYLKMNGMLSNSTGCDQLHCGKCRWKFCSLVSERTVGSVSTWMM